MLVGAWLSLMLSDGRCSGDADGFYAAGDASSVWSSLSLLLQLSDGEGGGGSRGGAEEEGPRSGLSKAIRGQ